MICAQCGGLLDEPRNRWYYSNLSLLVGFLAIGPFVLPFVWLNPDSSKRKKIILTVVISLLTFIFSLVFIKSVKNIIDYYQAVFSI